MEKKLYDLIKKALSTPDGREGFKEIWVKSFPECTHRAIIDLIDGDVCDAERFFNTVENDILDEYNKDGDESVFTILKSISDLKESRKNESRNDGT